MADSPPTIKGCSVLVNPVSAGEGGWVGRRWVPRKGATRHASDTELHTAPSNARGNSAR